MKKWITFILKLSKITLISNSHHVMKKLLLSFVIFYMAYILILEASSTQIYLDSQEAFVQLPSIEMNAYKYLSQAPEDGAVTRFIFVRHGESTANQDKSIAGRIDVDLTTKGREQAELVGKQLKSISMRFDAIYSSPSLRAQETAKLILSKLEQTPMCPTLDPRLYEKFYGPFEGASESEYAVVKQADETLNSGPEKSFEEKFDYKFHPEMESMAEVYFRTIDFLEEAQSKHQGQNVLVASHNCVLKALFMMDTAERGFDIDYRAYGLGNCALVIVEIQNNKVIIRATAGLKFLDKKKLAHPNGLG